MSRMKDDAKWALLKQQERNLRAVYALNPSYQNEVRLALVVAEIAKLEMDMQVGCKQSKTD